MTQQDKYLTKKSKNDDTEISAIVTRYDKKGWGPYFILEEMVKKYLRLGMKTKHKREKVIYREYIKILKRAMNNIVKVDSENSL